MKQKAITQVAPQVTPEVKRLLSVMTGDHYRGELQEILRLKNAEHFSDHSIENEREKF